MQRLETARLVLRDMTLDDAADMFEYAVLNEVGPRAGWPPHKNIEETREVIKSLANCNQVWAIEHKLTRKMIGTAGMHTSSDSEYPVLGIVISPYYQRQGLAREALCVVLEHTFVTMANDYVTAFVYEYNIPSKKLMYSLGFLNTTNNKLVHNYASKEIVQLELLLSKQAFFRVNKG